MKKRSANQIQKNVEMAKTVMKHHFNKVPKKIIYQLSGQTNFVFEAKMGHEDFIVRISSENEKIDDFKKEQWAALRVLEKGVPVAEILEVGMDIISRPYMLQKKIQGQEASYHNDRKKILQQMGKYCALINTIPTTGYGKVFDWCENKLSKNNTWIEYLENEIKVSHRLKIFSRYKMLSAQQLKVLKEYIDKVKKLKNKPVLNHGDMRLKNVIVDDKANVIAILDWEKCTSNIAPFCDLSHALHDLSIDDKQVFLEAYNLPKKEFSKMAYVYKVLNLLNYAKEIEVAAALKNKHLLDEYKLRLKGSYDFFCL